MARSIAFYERYCGMRVIHDRTDDFRVVWLGWETDRPQFAIVLLDHDYADNTQPPLQHIGIAVDSRAAVDEIIARAAADGADVAWQPIDGGEIVGYFGALRDPDGNVIELSYGQPLG